MRYLSFVISFLIGAILIPLIISAIALIKQTFIAIITTYLLYYLSGYFIGKKISEKYILHNSLLLGIGPLILVLYLLFALGWINEGDAGYSLLTLTLLIIYICYLGLKKGCSKAKNNKGGFEM